MTTLLPTLLLLLPLHALAIAGLWRAAWFPLRPCSDPRGWGDRFPLAAVDRRGAGVLWPLRYLCERYLPTWLQQPLLVCPACMATVHGPLPYLLTLGVTPLTLTTYLLYWPALSCLAAVLGRAVNPET